MKIESEDIDVRNLLSGSYFHVPRFQRAFSWEPEHIIQFWNDLVDNQGDEYFIGSMVLFRKGKQDYGVVDGQQRLTTITILLCSLRDAFFDLGDHNLASGLHLLVEHKNIENEDTFVLKTESSYPFFQDEIQRFGEPILQVKPGPEEENLSRAYEILREFVAKAVSAIENDPMVPIEHKVEQKIAKLKHVRDILLSLKLIKVTLENEDDAYIIFETLNTRGKDLALSDLVKNHFSKLIKKRGDVDTLKEKWQKLLELFQGSQADISPDSFITHFWASRYNSVTQRKVFPEFKKSVAKENALTSLDQMLSDALIYRKILEPSFGWEKSEKRAQDSLAALQLFRLSQPTPAVLSLARAYLGSKIKLKKFNFALEAIENFHFAFTAVTSSRSSGGISSMYSAFAKRLFESPDAQSASDEIDTLVQKLKERRPSYSEFVVGFEQILFTNSLTKQKALVRYILKRLSISQGFAFPEDWEDLSIEHIHPQDKIDGGEWQEDIVGQLGNLIYVTHDLNGKLAAKPFVAKKRILNASNQGFPTFIAEAPQWNPDTIVSHTEKLAELAYYNTWKL